MVIDLRAARKCSSELRTCLSRTEASYESTRRIMNALMDEEAESIREVVLDLRRNLKEQDEHMASLRAVIGALDGIINVYERTEKKNVSKVNGLEQSMKKITRLVDLGVVPADLLRFFR